MIAYLKFSHLGYAYKTYVQERRQIWPFKLQADINVNLFLQGFRKSFV